MSYTIPASSLTEELRDYILEHCTFTPKKTQYCENPSPIKFYRRNGDDIALPIGTWSDVCTSFPIKGKSTRLFEFTGSLLEGERDQTVAMPLALTHLHSAHTVLLALHTGYGKTTCSVYLSCALKRKTLVLCHLSSVNTQWVEAFRNFSAAQVRLLERGVPKTTDDVVVMGIKRAENLLLANPHVFDDFGTVIVDECHLSTKLCFSSVLLHIHPEYLIGLSATPDRADGMHVSFQAYFGDNIIKRTQRKAFVVVKHTTPFQPVMNYTIVNGKSVMDWNSVINSLAYNSTRQRMIVDIVLKHYREHRILILSSRVDECEALVELLRDKDIDVAPMFGSLSVTGTPNVIVAGRMKAGVGFNDPGLTMLILASDCKDVRQYEGRIRTHDNLVIDIVDKHSTLEKHWRLRRAWYAARGADIQESDSVKDSREQSLPSRRLLPF